MPHDNLAKQKLGHFRRQSSAYSEHEKKILEVSSSFSKSLIRFLKKLNNNEQAKKVNKC